MFALAFLPIVPSSTIDALAFVTASTVGIQGFPARFHYVFFFPSPRATTQIPRQVIYSPIMQTVWIALIVSFVGLGVSVASMLLPVKAWLHYWFPRLWPPSDQNDVRRPADLESGGVVRTEASRGRVLTAPAYSDQRAAQLRAPPGLVGRVQTLDPLAPSNLDGGRAVRRAASDGALARTDRRRARRST
jgi:hypothetical protein